MSSSRKLHLLTPEWVESDSSPQFDGCFHSKSGETCFQCDKADENWGGFHYKLREALPQRLDSLRRDKHNREMGSSWNLA